MKKACEALRAAAATGATRNQLLKGSLPPTWTTLLQEAPPSGASPPEEEKRKRLRLPDADLLAVCESFSNLQPFRHKADYDLAWMPDLQTAQSHLADADAALAAWTRCRHGRDAEIFLMASVDLLRFRET